MTQNSSLKKKENSIKIEKQNTNSPVNLLSLSVVRRDGSITPFKSDKISNAIKKSIFSSNKNKK